MKISIPLRWNSTTFCVLLTFASLTHDPVQVCADERTPTSAQSKSPAAKPASEKSTKAKNLQDALAVESEGVDKTIKIAIDTLQGKLKQAADLKGVSEDSKKRLMADYQRALDTAKLGQDWSAKAKSFEEKRAQAPAQIQQLRKATAHVSEAVDLGNTAPKKLSELEKHATDEEAKLEDVKKQQVKWDTETKRRNERRVEIGKQKLAARTKLDQLLKDIELRSQSKDPSEEASAARSLLLWQKYALEQELDCHARELLYYDASTEYPNLMRDAATQEANRIAKTAKAYRSLLLARRSAEAERAAEKARAEAAQFSDADGDPKLRQLALENSQLAKTRAGMVSELAQVDADLQRINEQTKAMQDAFKNIKEKVNVGGVSQVNGLLLRQLREKLPDVRRPRRNLRKLQQTLADVQLKNIELEEDRDELADFDEEVLRISAEAEIVPEDKQDYQQEVNKLLKAKKENVYALLSDYDKYLSKLGTLDSSYRQLIADTEKVAAFIRERVLWVRSSQPLNGSEWDDARAAATWMANRDSWTNVAGMLKADTIGHPVLIGSAFLIFLALNVFRGLLRRRLKAWGEIAVRPTTTEFAPTSRAVILTSLIAGVGPLPIWFLAWRLMVCLDQNESDFASALADGLFAVGLPFLALEFFRQVCRDKGLAEAHFGWKPRVLALIRGALRAMVLAGMPIIFLVEVIEASNRGAYTNSLGRSLLIAGLALLAYFAHRLFHPTTGAIKQLVADDPESSLNRLRMPIYLVAVGMPIGLAIFAGLGYYYSALQLTLRIKMSTWIGLGSLVGYGLMLRWLLIARRRMAFDQARKRREQQAEAKPTDASSAAAPDVAAQQQDLGLDLSTINFQTKRLLRSFMNLTFFVAMWGVWADVVPAGEWLNTVTVWNATIHTNETIANADGTNSVKSNDHIVPITLANLAMSTIIVFMTLAASRNVPGLLEISILQRLPLDAGGRYAITSVCRYLITIIGMILAFGSIGIGWASVQWLAAAMTVGLGFGLQEIVANFISGLILLFERPIRVGDTVTVGEVTGVVTRIRIRATTITDADRKELIVPNKEFITGKLMNWTLSDPTLRVMVRVGVAYGSNVDQVLQILERVGRSNHQVLRDPPPQSFIDGFGENTLNFSLRAFVPGIECLAKVKHDLHINVERALRAANIEPSSSHYDLFLHSMTNNSDNVAEVAGMIPATARRQSA